jgi:hypothetical protein
VDTLPALPDHERNADHMRVCLGFTIVFSLLEGALLGLCCCMAKHMSTASHLIALACASLKEMRALLIYPVLNIICCGSWLTLGFVVALRLGSCGDITPPGIYGTMQWVYDPCTVWAFLYWLFALRWLLDLEFTVVVGRIRQRRV